MVQDVLLMHFATKLKQWRSVKQAEDKGGGKGSKRKNAADARALEIEYLEGELQALAEKEREEVGAAFA